MYRQNAGTCHRSECGRSYETRLRPRLRQSPTVKRLPRIRHETTARGRRSKSRDRRTKSINQIHNRGRMTKQFNEAQATLEYLTSQLILARQTNELLTENNCRLERLLIKTKQNLQECQCLLDEMKFEVGELSTISLKRLTQ